MKTKIFYFYIFIITSGLTNVAQLAIMLFLYVTIASKLHDFGLYFLQFLAIFYIFKTVLRF